MEFKVHTFPTVMLYAQGEQVDSWSGLAAEKLEAKLNHLVKKGQ